MLSWYMSWTRLPSGAPFADLTIDMAYTDLLLTDSSSWDRPRIGREAS